ncbi:uncharacterized protein LAESUDRAFT_662392 [Laetiporus sulphureus 93-53]|uniref:Uncharacterized protein n=1 Tax=Laetiporus sulphureus 93-53 TaxID=1314785 RepID=A0A165C4N9_9APHY|nr:uncharacterized protein LAESUDRAFT_662392 [Laetiporus sulphureus 93-53]KZT02198.1 hypothetical protein LAESUDRAFT_662392 [Laetiporus sulphureus 93-53]
MRDSESKSAGPKVYYCNCPRFCKVQTRVSKTTYYAHRQYREGSSTRTSHRDSTSSSSVNSAATHIAGGEPRELEISTARKRRHEDDHELQQLSSAVDPGSLADPLDGALPDMPLPDSAVHSSAAVNDDNFADEFDDMLCAPRIEELRIAADFKRLLADASWENSDLDKDTIHCLQHPLEEPLSIDEDPDLLYSIELYLAVGSASQRVYESVCQAGLRRFPNVKILAYD